MKFGRRPLILSSYLVGAEGVSLGGGGVSHRGRPHHAFLSGGSGADGRIPFLSLAGRERQQGQGC